MSTEGFDANSCFYLCKSEDKELFLTPWVKFHLTLAIKKFLWTPKEELIVYMLNNFPTWFMSAY